MRTGYLVLLCLTSGRCFVNLLHDQKLSGTAEMNPFPVLQEWEPTKAIDGNTNQDLRQNSCAISEISRNSHPVWWRVWLQKLFNIAYIEIYFRKDAFYRATGFSIYIFNDTNYMYRYNTPSDGDLIYHHEADKGCIPGNGTMNITLNSISIGVAFFNSLDDRLNDTCIKNGDNVVDIGICEVRVMGCDQNRYGYGCTNLCPEKCKNRQCDVFNGTCIYGCQDPSAEKPVCQVCDDGKYALNGKCEPCGNCEDNIPCDNRTGNCSSGCKKNWTGNLCKECSDGYYDQNCTSQCGHCLAGDCDKINGSCLSGCKLNWKEPLCQECIDGLYDEECNGQCGHCLEGVCDKTNGTCKTGCSPNWQAPLCQECNDAMYGQQCSNRCGHCLDEFCNKRNGKCLSGCKQNWKEPLCQECVDGIYGESCNTQCGYCIQRLCDKRNGTCMMGCLQGWEGSICQVYTTRDSKTSDEEFSRTSLVVISVISTLLGVVLLSTLIIVIYIKRTRCLQHNDREHSNNDQMSRKDREQKYAEIPDNKEDHQYSTIDSVKKESEYQEIHTYRNTELNEVI